MDGREAHQKLENNIKESMRRLSGSQAEPLATMDLTTDETKTSCLAYSEATNGCGNNEVSFFCFFGCCSLQNHLLFQFKGFHSS